MARQTYYEDVYRHRPTLEAPLLCNDFKVIAHSIAQYCRDQSTIETFSAHLADYTQAAWAYRLNRGPHYLKMPQQGWRSVVFEDSKPYWRHTECEMLRLPEYKAGRGAHEETFKTICRIGKEYCKSAGIPFFAQQGMEADDWAGAAYRIKIEAPLGSHVKERSMFLVTVDGDWMQLVSSEDNILWANTGPWTPRLRGDREVVEHTQRKMGQRISRPRDMARAKERVGDLGDNLLKGSPLHLYDLCNRQINELYQVERSSQYEMLRFELEQPRSNGRPEHIAASLSFINSLGFQVPN